MGLLGYLKKLLKRDIPKERVSIEPVSYYIPKTTSVRAKIVNPRFPHEYLYELEKVILTNPDLSHAHQIFLDLVNTDIDIHVEPFSEELKKEIEEFIHKVNIDNLKRHLFNQLIIYGAVSAEAVVSPKLDGVDKIVRVPVPTIYFVYNEEEDKFEPYQIVGSEEIKLNTNTYIYKPLLTLDGSPYGIPPFLAVLSIVDTQSEVLNELKNLAKKIGLLGFVDIKLPTPERLEGETETEYRKRLQEMLKEEAQRVQEEITKGIVVHYDSSEVKYERIETSDLGKGIIDQIELWLLSASKLQPSLLGRTTGSTETWATVAYAQFVKQLQNMQQLVEDVLEYFIGLHLTLKGLEFKHLEVSFEQPPELNPKLNEEALKTKADRVIALYQAGLLSYEEARKELGYDPTEIETEKQHEHKTEEEWF